MPPSVTHTGPSSASPANDSRPSDNTEDQPEVDAGGWKRRFLVLQESVNAQTASKRKAG